LGRFGGSRERFTERRTRAAIRAAKIQYIVGNKVY